MGLVTKDCIVMSDRMLMFILSMLVKPLEMSIEAADALAPLAGNLKAKDLWSPLRLMCVYP